MYNLGSGTHIPKYNPIYVVSDRPNISLYKPVSVPVIRWQLYTIEFKIISPHTRWRRYDCCTTKSSWRHDHAVAMISCVVMLIFAMMSVTLLYGGFGRHGADLLRRNQTKPDITRCSQVESARWFHFLLIEVWCQCPHSPLILWMIWCSPCS